jgi:hypothetical protein
VSPPEGPGDRWWVVVALCLPLPPVPSSGLPTHLDWVATGCVVLSVGPVSIPFVTEPRGPIWMVCPGLARVER